MRKTHHTLLLTFLLAMVSVAANANTAVEPTPKGDWILRHLAMVERAQAGDIDLLLLGDSITDWWDKKATEVFEDTFGDYKVANFGISADRTQHVLWRLRNGIGEGFNPKVTVLMIGTNNTGWEKDKVTPRNSPQETIEGIYAVVYEIRTRFPDTKLLLFGLFPRGEKDNPQREQIAIINEAISKLHNGDNLFYYDIGDQFLDENGDIPEALMPDKLHPSAEGYKIWAAALKEPLETYLK